ncbi:hypothetical protein BJY21_003714 [Kineosphaera limosa]|uniref:Uncharacterized protein n=1 Tax=Kineosphaera limosa NBRC 100340 TaxID=1184609 RepID=K6XEB5_9MICO|nr:hypothetical protein [Kineosphaera limosa]NYE02530.1 hypothetical protein [Kineosphaera limosa]GAB97169.1 hypothetical protein KILIM_058_00210 [Kineosphaera limosa NBRC 100340]
MPVPARANTVISLDRLRLAMVRNSSAARRNGEQVPVDPLVAAAQAQARALRDVRTAAPATDHQP